MVGKSCNPLILLFQHDKPEISANNRGTLISTFKSLDRFDETDLAQDYPVTASPWIGTMRFSSLVARDFPRQSVEEFCSRLHRKKRRLSHHRRCRNED